MKSTLINRMVIHTVFISFLSILFSIDARGETSYGLKTSYELQKTGLHVDRYGIRYWNDWGLSANGIAYADFDNDGDEDVFMAPSIHGSTNPLPVEMYLNDGRGNFTYDTSLFHGPIPGCIVGRKVLVGDFNRDNRPDIFVADTGLDFPPWPGASPLLLLSSPDGLQQSGDFSSIVGYHHGAASADIDRDGDLDIFVTSMLQPFFLINDGKGNFTYTTGNLPAELSAEVVGNVTVIRNLYTAELIDIDLDGCYDLLVAGHEWEKYGKLETSIYWGNQTGVFSAQNKTKLPGVAEWGTVVDIDAEDIDNDGDVDIVLNRTGDSTMNPDNFYVGCYIQIIINSGSRQFIDDTPSRISDGAIDPDWVGWDRFQDRMQWISWIRLQDINGDQAVDIIVDDAALSMVWLNNGEGQFALTTDINFYKKVNLPFLPILLFD